MPVSKTKDQQFNNHSYPHKEIDGKWQKLWLSEQIYHPAEMDKVAPSRKYYNLWMFPYPSAEGLHAGHAFASTGSDIHGRYKRMHGYQVFQPIGYDSFGIHSENFALKIGEHPEKMLERTTKNYAHQLQSLGHGYDWTRTVTTSDTDYYIWTQWLFKEMFKAGLAYRKSAKVNWCPSCKTVLADEQVMSPKQAGKVPPGYSSIEDVPPGVNVCERCGSVAEIKNLEQWFFRITDYADRLLENLSKIDWPEKIKIAQTNWIGRKEGLNITYSLKDSQQSITVWTSRPDTNFGATFIVISPEHPLVKDITTQEHIQDVSEYIKVSQTKSKEERLNDVREKTGVFTGSYAINHLTGREMPIYVTDFVLMDVGTGAVVGVPAHDERDYAFARKFKLPIKKVIDFNTETHSLVIQESVSGNFLKQVGKNKWYWMDYEGWGYGVVFPKGDEDKFIKTVQSSLNEGKWFVHTDGCLKTVIFKDKYFNLPVKNTEAKEHALKIGIPEEQLTWDVEDNYLFCYTGDGKVVNSGFLNGLSSSEAMQKIMDYLVEKGWGVRSGNYHLRDWLISRQRYWGPPIPMVYCEKCAEAGKSYFSRLANPSALLHSDQSDWDCNGWYPEENLPVKLPHIEDYQPEGSGRGPLANHPEFYKTVCPECGAPAIRETDVSDTFLDSAWYFLRYPSVDAESYDKLPFDPEITKKWLPVDLYFGGAEHSVLHLMYCRFTTMVLHDLRLLSFEEPCPRFFAHGLMIKDGAKMSKSRGNVVNPDEYINKFGADALRLYLMFMGPMDGYPDFRDTGIEGMKRFVDRVWNLLISHNNFTLREEDKSSLQIKIHQAIKKVTEDIEKFQYNTAISAIMELVNVMKDAYQQAVNDNKTLSGDKQIPGDAKANTWKEAKKTLVLLLAPFAPHLAEEVWVNYLHNKFTVHQADWPEFQPQLLVETKVNIIVQVNGKLRGTLKLEKEIANDKDKVITLVKSDDSIAKWLEGQKVKYEIFVPQKLINFVI